MTTRNVLLVMSDQDGELRELIYGVLESATDIQVDKEKNIQRALERLQPPRTYDFLVCGLALAPNATSSVSENGGLTLAAEVRKLSKVPVALILPQWDPTIQNGWRTIPEPAPIPYSVEPTLPEQLLAQVRAAKAPLRRLNITIDASGGVDWSYRITSTGFIYEPASGTLRIGKGSIRMQKQVSDDLSHAGPAKWYESFCSFGLALIESLCDSEAFRAHVQAGIAQAGGLENTRVAFVVGRETYPIALEAIFRPDKIPDPWMVHAPLIRNLSGSESVRTELLDGPQQQLRCLIVCADTHGRVDSITVPGGKALQLDELPNVQRECSIVERLLKRPSNCAPVPHVEVFPKKGEVVTRSSLITKIQDRWDMVHFAGHSLYHSTDAMSGRGYVFVGPKNQPEAVSISDIAPRLKESRLVYLSGCQTASAAFAIEAADAGIPAIIGFRWPVDDSRAAVHAAHFYRRLFAQDSIDTAFRNVRRTMHRRYLEKSNIWASAMLVMGRRQ